MIMCGLIAQREGGFHGGGGGGGTSAMAGGGVEEVREWFLCGEESEVES
jgi:hypothetical protein